MSHQVLQAHTHTCFIRKNFKGYNDYMARLVPVGVGGEPRPQVLGALAGDELQQRGVDLA